LADRKRPCEGRQSSSIPAQKGRSSFISHAALISLLLLVGSATPASARAGIVSDFLVHLRGEEASALSQGSGNLQTLELPKPAMNFDPTTRRGGGEVTIVDGSALVPDEGPSGTIADIERPKNSTISVYVVRPGDTLSDIGKMFDVSVNTIKWANDIPTSGTIRIGQTLTILPVTGVKYVVKKGDTLSTIAKKFDGDSGEIASYNGLEDGPLAVGSEIIIPNGEISAPTPSSGSKSAPVYASPGTPNQVGYYLRPIAGGVRTQGIHGYNGVDLAAPAGTQIFAAADGEVIVAKASGWNGGYGEYVVIQHTNGSQTLYSHASSVIVGVGQQVRQGQVIAYVGSTGRATGAHVHFEIRNGIRNPF